MERERDYPGATGGDRRERRNDGDHEGRRGRKRRCLDGHGPNGLTRRHGANRHRRNDRSRRTRLRGCRRAAGSHRRGTDGPPPVGLNAAVHGPIERRRPDWSYLQQRESPALRGGRESRALGCPTAEFRLVGVEHYGNSSAEIIREHLGVLPADMDGHHPRLLGVTTEKGDSRGV